VERLEGVYFGVDGSPQRREERKERQ
jgi:hypothetical protein